MHGSLGSGARAREATSSSTAPLHVTILKPIWFTSGDLDGTTSTRTLRPGAHVKLVMVEGWSTAAAERPNQWRAGRGLGGQQSRQAISNIKYVITYLICTCVHIPRIGR